MTNFLSLRTKFWCRWQFQLSSRPNFDHQFLVKLQKFGHDDNWNWDSFYFHHVWCKPRSPCMVKIWYMLYFHHKYHQVLHHDYHGENKIFCRAFLIFTIKKTWKLDDPFSFAPRKKGSTLHAVTIWRIALGHRLFNDWIMQEMALRSWGVKSGLEFGRKSGQIWMGLDGNLNGNLDRNLAGNFDRSGWESGWESGQISGQEFAQESGRESRQEIGPKSGWDSPAFFLPFHHKTRLT